MPASYGMLLAEVPYHLGQSLSIRALVPSAVALVFVLGQTPEIGGSGQMNGCACGEIVIDPVPHLQQLLCSWVGLDDDSDLLWIRGQCLPDAGEVNGRLRHPLLGSQ